MTEGSEDETAIGDETATPPLLAAEPVQPLLKDRPSVQQPKLDRCLFRASEIFSYIFLGLVQSEGADLLSHCRGVGAILARAIEFVSAQNILKRRYTIHNI